jgi:ABC-type multidrug transport system ATPase subunit
MGGVNIPCRPSMSNQEFNLYTIVYNISAIPNGFLDSFNAPLPTDERLLKLKILVDNAYLDYYSRYHPKYENDFNNINLNSTTNLNYTNSQQPKIPKIQKISTQAYPSPSSRISSNANVISLFGVFYLYFPPMILFSIILLDLVKEKESMLKNYTNIYGLSIIGYWISWIIISMCFSLIIALEFCFFGKFIFHYDVFDNANILVPFLLFFLFTLTMQCLAMYLSCWINSTKTATTISYSIILIGIVVQIFFTNYGIVYFFYATNLDSMNFLVKMILIILHFYPPFLFSKSYLNIYRICSYHFDSPKLQWVPGRYFELKDIFEEEIGKLRIGVEFEVESLLVTMMWFLFLIIFFLCLLAISEMKENYKYSEKNNEGGFFNFFNIFKVFKIFDFFRLFKDLSTITSLKRLNIKKQRLEDAINKNFEKFLKSEQKSNPILNEEYQNLSFTVKDNHISVTNEKKLVATLNKKGIVPNGIRIMSVSKKYPNGLKALNDINIEISKDEVFTILGPNGAGKSTLINILTSQISSSEGLAKVGPFMIHSDLFIDSIYLKRMIGICSQFDYFWEDLTVYETLYVYSRLRGISLNKIENYIDEKIFEVGLERKKFEKVSKLSGGMRRRLSICISTLGDPFIIFMDEPTSGLDPNNRRKIWKLINNIKKNRVIILTTHIMEEAEYLSDRLGIIIGGKLRFIGNCTEMRKIYWDGIILTLSNCY